MYSRSKIHYKTKSNRENLYNRITSRKFKSKKTFGNPLLLIVNKSKIKDKSQINDNTNNYNLHLECNKSINMNNNFHNSKKKSNFLSPKYNNIDCQTILNKNDLKKKSFKDFYNKHSRNKENNKFETKYTVIDNNSVYNSILLSLENLMLTLKNDNYSLYDILIKIKNYINKIINEKYAEYYNNENTNETKKIKYKVGNESCDFNLLSRYDYKNISEENFNHLIKKIKNLSDRIIETEKDFKIKELKYLFCIGEQQKKILDLENYYYPSQSDDLTKESKSQNQYKNYKSSITNNKNQKTIKNSKSFYINFNSPKQNSFNKTKKRYSANESIKIKNSIHGYCHTPKSRNNKIYLNSNNFNSDTINNNNNEDDNKYEIEEIKKIITYGKLKAEMFTPGFERLFGEGKKYFLSHPKLDYIKKDKQTVKLNKINEQLGNCFPTRFGKVKLTSKVQKNAAIDFSYFMNDSLINLDKLIKKKNLDRLDKILDNNRYQEKNAFST